MDQDHHIISSSSSSSNSSMIIVGPRPDQTRQGTVKGGRRRGRQRKTMEDNIREWTGLEFTKSQRAVENEGKWRKLSVNSSVVRQRPWRFRDR